MQKILSVGAWFFGVIFIISGIGILFGGSVIAGLLMLIGAGLLLPPVKRLILDKKINLSRGKITAVGSILIFISFFFIPSDNEVTDENQALTSESAAETKQDVVEPETTTPEPTTVVVKEKEPIEVATIPVENNPIEEPEPTIEETKITKPVDVIKAAPSKPSTAEKRQDIDTIKVRAILDEIDQEVKEAKGFDIKNGAEVAKKSRRVNAINQEMMALAKEMPSIGSENGKVRMFCGIAVGEGAGYWRNVMFSHTDKDLETSKRLLKNYQESKESCLDAIKEFENS